MTVVRLSVLDRLLRATLQRHCLYLKVARLHRERAKQGRLIDVRCTKADLPESYTNRTARMFRIYSTPYTLYTSYTSHHTRYFRKASRSSKASECIQPTFLCIEREPLRKNAEAIISPTFHQVLEAFQNSKCRILNPLPDISFGVHRYQISRVKEGGVSDLDLFIRRQILITVDLSGGLSNPSLTKWIF